MNPRPITALFASFLAGCFAPGSVERAETLGKGQYQVSIEPGAVVATVEGESIVLPTFQTSFRFGVSDRFDIGGRIGTSGGRLLTKYMFTKPGATGVRLALAPNIGGFAIGAGTGEGSGGFAYVDAVVPLMIGIPVTEHELTFGPRLHDTLFFAGSGGESAMANLLYVGSSIGFSIQASKKFGILPEVTLEYPLVASAGAGGETDSEFNTFSGLLIGFNIGFQIEPKAGQ